MSPNEKPPLTEEQVKVYQIVFNMAMQGLLAIAGLVAFFIVLCYFLSESNHITKIILGACDSLLSPTIFLVYKYFFSTSGKTSKKPSKPK